MPKKGDGHGTDTFLIEQNGCNSAERSAAADRAAFTVFRVGFPAGGPAAERCVSSDVTASNDEAVAKMVGK
jgi:hypothetical protein